VSVDTDALWRLGEQIAKLRAGCAFGWAGRRVAAVVVRWRPRGGLPRRPLLAM